MCWRKFCFSAEWYKLTRMTHSRWSCKTIKKCPWQNRFHSLPPSLAREMTNRCFLSSPKFRGHWMKSPFDCWHFLCVYSPNSPNTHCTFCHAAHSAQRSAHCTFCTLRTLHLLHTAHCTFCTLRTAFCTLCTLRTAFWTLCTLRTYTQPNLLHTAPYSHSVLSAATAPSTRTRTSLQWGRIDIGKHKWCPCTKEDSLY